MSAYTQLDSVNDIITNNSQLVTTGIWSGGAGVLNTFFTSSVESASYGQYFLNIYQTESNQASAEIQFAVSYGSYNNSGSGIGDLTFPALATYAQYTGLLLNSGISYFSVNGSIVNDCIFINVQRNRYKEQIDTGTWQLILSGSGGNSVISLIDNSNLSGSTINGSSGAAYSIVSGSYSTSNGQSVVYNQNNPVYYGLFYPANGTFVLNAAALASSKALGGYTASNYFNASSSAILESFFRNTLIGGNTTIGNFVARSSENVKNSIYFIRVKNRDYNYSTNPTYFDSSGNINSQFISAPISYITTVGLYDNNQNLLAVAKLSAPIQKNQERELLLKCKIDW